MIMKITQMAREKAAIICIVLTFLLSGLLSPVKVYCNSTDLTDWEISLRNTLYKMPSLFDENAIIRLQNESKKPPDAIENMIPVAYACYDFQNSGVPSLVVTYADVGRVTEKNYLYTYEKNEYESKDSFEGGEFYTKGTENIVFVERKEGIIQSFSYVSFNDGKLVFTEYIDANGLNKESNVTVDLEKSIVTEIDSSLKAMLKVDVSRVGHKVETALNVEPEYEYGDYTSEKKQLARISSALMQVVNKDTAMHFIQENVNNLPKSDWENSAGWDNIVRMIELSLQRGLQQESGAGEIVLNSGSLGASVASAEEMRAELMEYFKQNDFRLSRDFRINLQINSNDDVSGIISYDDTLRAVYFDQVAVATPFATLTFNKNDLQGNGNVSLENRAWIQTKKEGIDIFQLWSLPIIAVVLLLWIFNKSLRMRLRYWVVPTVSILLACVNVGFIVIIDRSEASMALAHADNSGVTLELNEVKSCILSLPVNDELQEASEFLIYDENGTPIFSLYNPLTGMIDGIVTNSGKYSVQKNDIQFLDIGKENDLTRNSIRSLAALNIMPGTTDNMFYPEKFITRAEFVAAILRIFRQVDENARSTFTDISEDDWYYADVATTQKLGIIAGFDDNTFRGDVTIPKVQMVFAAMQSLSSHMGYKETSADEANTILYQYIDYKSIPEWSSKGVAIASQIGLVLNRTDFCFAPNEPMTRGDAAIMLHRVLEKSW